MNFEEKQVDKIALIEDEPSHALLMSFNLESRGKKVSHFESGEQFLTLDEKMTFDLIIINVHLHNDEGLQLCTTIRNTIAEVPILFVTTSPSLENCSCTGEALDYLVKPFSMTKLINKVNQLLASHESKKECVYQ